MSYLKRMWLYELTMADSRLVDQYGQPFNMRKYSRFKYGSDREAKEYGYALGRLVVRMQTKLFSDVYMGTGKQLAVASAPYNVVPKGAKAVADYFTEFVNEAAFLDGTTLKEIKISIQEIKEGDYGHLSDQQRQQRNQETSLAVTTSELEGGVHLFILDDARITGGTEGLIEKFFHELNIPSLTITYLYLVQLDPALGKQFPTLEQRMNDAMFSPLDQLLTMVVQEDEGYRLNARVCKFILSYTDLWELRNFLREVTPSFVITLYQGAKADGLHTMRSYKDAFRIVEEVMQARQLS